MPMVKKSITVTDKQNNWIQLQLQSGHYASDSELLRDLIRKEQQRMEQDEMLRDALLSGEKSGISEKSVTDVFMEAKAQYKSR